MGAGSDSDATDTDASSSDSDEPAMPAILAKFLGGAVTKEGHVKKRRGPKVGGGLRDPALPRGSLTMLKGVAGQAVVLGKRTRSSPGGGAFT